MKAELIKNKEINQYKTVYYYQLLKQIYKLNMILKKKIIKLIKKNKKHIIIKNYVLQKVYCLNQ